MINNSPAGIYIHVPFCQRKCSYCDFYSWPLADKSELERYVQNLLRAMTQQAGDWEKYQFSTVYMGGGTPSLLSPEQVAAILSGLRHHLHIHPDAEISLEANPATLNCKQLRELKNVGLNRISLGVQSFQAAELKVLGRAHGVQTALQAVDDIIKAGFDNYNLDLIYGIPGQTRASWQHSLKTAVTCCPRHISAYLLQLDSGVALARQISAGRFKAPSEDLEADMYYDTLDYLINAGFRHYEISNFARPGYECRHNLIYWQANEYLGLGPGAVSFRAGQRWMNPAPKSDRDFLTAAEISTVETLETMDERGRFVDALILGLRLTEGISRRQFIERFSIDFYQEYHSIIERFSRNGLLIAEPDRIYLSRRGYYLSNQLLAELL